MERSEAGRVINGLEEFAATGRGDVKAHLKACFDCALASGVYFSSWMSPVSFQ